MQTNPNSRYKVRPGRVITDTNRGALFGWEALKGLLLGCGFTRVAEEDEQVETALRKGVARHGQTEWGMSLPAAPRYPPLPLLPSSLYSPFVALLSIQRQLCTGKIQTPSRNVQGHFQTFSSTFLEIKSKQSKKKRVSVHHHLLLLLIISCFINLQPMDKIS